MRCLPQVHSTNERIAPTQGRALDAIDVSFLKSCPLILGLRAAVMQLVEHRYERRGQPA
jgi:hypothetical protein